LAAVLAIAAALTIGSARAAQPNSGEFAVTDSRLEISRTLGPHLILKIRSAVDAQGRRFGWDLSVSERRLGDWVTFFTNACAAMGRGLTISTPGISAK